MCTPQDDELAVRFSLLRQGVVKLTKNRLISPQEIAVGSRCGHDKLCRSSEIVRQLDCAPLRYYLRAA
jgi:hypothetical protein